MKSIYTGESPAACPECKVVHLAKVTFHSGGGRVVEGRCSVCGSPLDPDRQDGSRSTRPPVQELPDISKMLEDLTEDIRRAARDATEALADEIERRERQRKRRRGRE